MNDSESWARRALEHGRVLSSSIGARGAASDGERRAAGYVRNELRQLGLPTARLEPLRGAVSTWMPWSIAFSLALWGVFAGLLLDQVGGLVARLRPDAHPNIFKQILEQFNDLREYERHYIRKENLLFSYLER